MADEKETYKRHPIQLEFLKVVELRIKANLDVDQEIETDTTGFTLKVGSSQYDEGSKTIAVKVAASIDSGEEHAPFDLFVELLGVFSVDESKFPLEYVDDWAQRNAPLVLYPYLREHVFGLASRCGYQSVLLPLLEIPTFKVVQEKLPSQSASSKVGGSEKKRPPTR